MSEEIQGLISKGENSKVEFKEAKNGFPRSAYETICAFLNADGGTIILGVDDNGHINGISHKTLQKIETDFAAAMNNTQLISPAVFLSVERAEIDGKFIALIKVPNSSAVHRYKNRIYLRNASADIDITDRQEQVSRLYLQKDNTYYENKIFPYLPIEELRHDLIERAKRLAKANNANNDWIALDNKDFLCRNKLYIRDYASNQEGVTLACVLLFGTDEQILSVVPGFRIELLKRVDNIERYDDRLTLSTNLLDCMDLALGFVEKHLPTPFYLQGTQRIDLRNNIFREVIANMLAHRSYSSGIASSITIYKNEILAENSSKPQFRGIITPKNTVSYAKNPNIARIFRGIGYVEELGSGIPKLFRYCKEYSGFEPVIEDGDVFSFTLRHNFFPMKNDRQGTKSDFKSDQVRDQDNTTEWTKINSERDQVDEQKGTKLNTERHQDNIFQKIAEICQEPKSLQEIMDSLGYKDKTKFRNKYIKPLLEQGLLSYTVPEKPNSRNQKYISVLNY